MVVAVVGKPASLSPILDRSLPARSAQDALFRGLVQFRADGSREAEWAAAIPSHSAGTFHRLGGRETESFFTLRPGACWSDGAPLTMQDFIFAHTMAVYPPLKALHDPWTSLLPSYTLNPGGHLRLVARRSPTVDPLDLFPLPAHLLAGAPDCFESLPWHQAPVGCGPFAITAVHSGSVEMARNARFLPQPAHLAHLTIDWYGTLDDAIVDIEKGSLDVIADVPPERAARWQPARGVTLLRTPGPSLAALVFNTRDLVMRHDRARQAFVLAVDRPKLCAALGADAAFATDSWLPPTHRAYVPAFRRYRFDPKAAREALAESRWQADAQGALRRGGEVHPITLLVPAGRPDLARAADLLQQAWRALGVRTEVEIRPAAVYQRRLQHRDFAAALEQMGVYPWTEPAAGFAEESIPTDRNSFRGDNVAGWSAPAMQDLLSVIAAAAEPASAAAALKKQQVLLAQAVPILPLYFLPQITAVRSGLEGVRPRGWGAITWNVEDWHWK